MNSPAWPILLVTLGFVLLVAEVFIPSGGIIGVLAIGLIVWGVWLAFQASFAGGATLLVAVIVTAPVAVGLAFSLWPKTPLGRRMILSPPDADVSGGGIEGRGLQQLLGATARATTPLRPSGRIELEGKDYDGLAESGLIPAGAVVVVVGFRAGGLVVRERDGGSSAEPTAIASGPGLPPEEDPLDA